MQVNPQVVFEELFGDGGTPAERVARRSQQRSILDSVMGSLSTLQAKVGASDRERVDQYLEDVARDRAAPPDRSQGIDRGTRDRDAYGVPDSFDEHIKLQFDLLALAFQGDISRVATLLYARDLTGRVYPAAARISASTAVRTTRKTRAASRSTRS
jgi:hypothetical protein